MNGDSKSVVVFNRCSNLIVICKSWEIYVIMDVCRKLWVEIGVEIVL